MQTFLATLVVSDRNKNQSIILIGPTVGILKYKTRKKTIIDITMGAYGKNYR